MTPLEPLYTLRVAVEMIPFPSLTALTSYLGRHADEYPPRYRRARRGYVRLLTLTECARLRAAVVKPSRKNVTQAEHPRRKSG